MTGLAQPDPFAPAGGPIPLAEFRERVLALYRPPLRARTTFLAVRRTLDHLAALGGVESTADLTTATVARFVVGRTGKDHPNTIRTHLRKLSALCSIAQAEGWLRVNPFKVRRGWIRGVAPTPPRVHSRAELGRVLAHAAWEAVQASPLRRERWKARRLYALAAVAIYTGVRATEALTLRLEDLDLDGRIITLRSRPDAMLKTDAAAQPVPMPEALAAILRGWVGHVDGPWLFPNQTGQGPWTGGPAGKRPVDAMKALGGRAGVPGLTFRSCRHSFATHAEFFGLTEAQLQRLLRHTNTKTQLFYRHAELENLRALADRIDFASPPAASEQAAAASPDAPPGAALVDYRPIPGFPRHRIGSDRSVWSNIRRDGHERPGDAPGPWRRLRENVRREGWGAVVILRRDGRSCHRTLAGLMRDVFPELEGRRGAP